MVYAVIESGGKQYKAVEGAFIEVDLLPEELGKKKVFDKVLLLVNDAETLVGSPYLPDVSIETKISEHFKGPKITIFNYRAKQRYRVKIGHRQKYTRLLVESIYFPGKPKEAKSEKPVEEVVAPAKKARSKPAPAAKKGSDKPVKAKTAAVKAPKAKAVTEKTVKKPVKKVSSTKTEK